MTDTDKTLREALIAHEKKVVDMVLSCYKENSLVEVPITSRNVLDSRDAFLAALAPDAPEGPTIEQIEVRLDQGPVPVTFDTEKLRKRGAAAAHTKGPLEPCSACGGETYVTDLTRCRGCDNEFYTAEQSRATSKAHTKREAQPNDFENERPDTAPLKVPLCQTCGQDWDADVAAERCTYPECPYLDDTKGEPQPVRNRDLAEFAKELGMAACALVQKREG